MEKIWKTKPRGEPTEISRMVQLLKIEDTLANLLIQRGIRTFEQAKVFFRPELKDLHDPFLMKDMDKAIERLDKAIANDEKILIYGDYDVDGTTSVALVYSYLRKIYNNIEFYIPDRYTEGYGVSFKGIDYAADNKFSLVIALDCGIKAINTVKYAKERGVDFIICDHHTPGDALPCAVAVLDPKREDCNYPYNELSGCGVGFKLLQAFASTHNLPFEELSEHLDLVCVSIASDIVQITGENRVLAFYGLKQLNDNPRPGLRSIIEIASLENKQITISDSVFKIGPRINAAGRIESGKQAVELLISNSKATAFTMGEKIDNFNTTRKNLDQLITQEALQMINNSPELRDRKTTVLFKPDWHKGVIGIVASRLIESYYRPTVVLTQSHGLATGSARSVPGYNLYNAIDSCSDLLEGFGGHMYAAGLTIKLENLDKFRNRFEEYVSQTITDEQLKAQIEIDQEISFKDITPRFYRILKQFRPFGPENMSPVFVTHGVRDSGASRIVGSTNEHLKLDLVESNVQATGIGFGLAEHFSRIKSGKPFSVCYSIEENDFKGTTKLQLNIKDIKF